MEEEETIAFFERCIYDQLTAEEMAEFKLRLATSEEFRTSFEAYVSFGEDIRAGFDYVKFKSQLGSIHHELYSPKKAFFLRPLFYLPLGIAASIAFMVYINIDFGTSSDNLAYEQLTNSVESAAEEETLDGGYGYEAAANYNGNSGPLNDSLPRFQNLPKGTAFLISSQGYFLTSKHLVNSSNTIRLQQKELGLTFETKVIYTDSVADFAVLQCSPNLAATFSAIPYSANLQNRELGEDVFSMGYPKREIVYTKGVISSSAGFESDSNYFEVSLPSNSGQSGSPLFNDKGEFLGVITAKRMDQEAVTYVLKTELILHTLADSIINELKTPKKNKFDSKTDRIKTYHTFIFEVH